MRKLILAIPALLAAALATHGCGPSAEEMAKQRTQDSLDSLRRADSIFDAQTADMLIADTVMQYNADVIHGRRRAGKPSRDVINPGDEKHNQQEPAQQQ